jgi:hypothetical protein
MSRVHIFTLFLESVVALILILGPGLAQGNEHVFRLDVPPYSMSHVQHANQGPFLDCYANTAAMMIDAFRYSHGDADYGFQSSALMLAADVSRAQGKRDLSFGYPWEAVHQARISGICNDKTMALKNGQNETESPEDFFWRYACHQTDLQRELVAPKATDASMVGLFKYQFRYQWQRFQQKIRVNQEAQGYAMEIHNELERDGFSGRDIAYNSDLAEILLNLGTTELVEAFRPTFCHGRNLKRAKIPEPQVLSLMPQDPPVQLPSNWQSIENQKVQEFQAQVMSILRGPHPQPIGVLICLELIGHGFGFNTHVLSQGINAKCDPHASLIIGYRTNPRTNRLDFLFQNTIFAGSDKYSRAWEYEPATKDAWIDAETFMTNAYALTWLPNADL